MLNDYNTDYEIPCHYCVLYNEITSDYPINSAIPKSLEIFRSTPRCQFHYQYMCNFCKKEHHFNGISYCRNCDKFTCLDCGESIRELFDFFIYDYYYVINCVRCSRSNPALDAAEYFLQHPFQTGAKRPDFPISLWIPTGNNYVSTSSIGKNFLAKFQSIQAMKLEESHDDSTELWSSYATMWSEGILNDKNHLYLLHPTILGELGELSGKTILDLGCRSGGLTRKLTLCDEIVGLDPSNMIDLAMKMENEDPKGIIYIKKTLSELKNKYQNYFDIIVANAVFMDIPDLNAILNECKNVLKVGGQLIFTIVHPCFNSPALNTVRFPIDSHRNEDRIKIAGNYFDEGTYELTSSYNEGDLIIYHRTISTYLNCVLNSGLSLEKVIEPKVTEKVVEMFPRQFSAIHDKLPMFFGILSRKPKM